VANKQLKAESSKEKITRGILDNTLIYKGEKGEMSRGFSPTVGVTFAVERWECGVRVLGEANGASCRVLPFFRQYSSIPA
jgi:hypothetical protein